MKYDHYFIQQANKWEQTWVYRPFVHERYNFPLLLKMAGYGKWLTGESYTRTQSTDFFLEYVCAGDAHFIQDSREYVVRPGEVYLLRKGASHTYSAGPANFILKRFVQIAGTGIEHYLQALGLRDQDVVRPQNSHKFERLLKQVTTFLAHSSSDGDIDLHVQLSCLAYQILLELSLSIQSSVPVLVENALTFMHENLHRTLSRQDICDHVGISMPYFNRQFSQHMHCTPIAYFLRQKFNWAAQLLKTTSLSVKEISYKTGFDDPLYFSAQFKKQFGVSPRQYRRHAAQKSEQERKRSYHPCATR